MWFTDSYHRFPLAARRPLLTGAVICAGLNLTGCATTGRIHVSSVQARDARFATERSFRFLPVPASRAEQPDAVRADNPMLENSISGREVRHSITDALTARGYTHRRDTADLAIAYYIGSHSTLVVTNYDYGYAFWDWKNGQPAIVGSPQPFSAYEYQEGTVIIDVLDADAKHILWRGVGRSPVPDDPAQYAHELKRVVHAIMGRFPGHPAPAVVASAR